MELNSDGSMVGKTFSGPDYKGEYPRSKRGEETYKQFYDRVQVLREQGYHIGDLSWGEYHTYCYGSPEGGGQYVQREIIGRESDDCWVSDDDDDDDDDDDWY